ncbi:hypothetical protein NA57DRAFT_50441, partial [Rhizodiscina lignyota]
NASNINNKLLPSPIAIIATTGLLYYIIALIASSYNPLNSTSSPTNFRNYFLISIFRITTYLLNSSSSTYYLLRAATKPCLAGSYNADSNIKNLYYSLLTF